MLYWWQHFRWHLRAVRWNGSVECCNDNSIPDNILLQCDEKGNDYILLEEIVDHRKNDKAVKNGRCMDPYEVGDSMKEDLEKETNNATAFEFTTDGKIRVGHAWNHFGSKMPIGCEWTLCQRTTEREKLFFRSKSWNGSIVLHTCRN